MVQKHHLQLHKYLPKDLILLPGYNYKYMNDSMQNHLLNAICTKKITGWKTVFRTYLISCNALHDRKIYSQIENFHVILLFQEGTQELTL